MVRLIISGCNGRMGRAVEAICTAEPDVEIVAGFDLLGAGEREFPVFASPADFRGEADVVVDFSSPAALNALLHFARSRRIPLVLCTTGYLPEQLSAIDAAARQIPIFRSANMSFGVNVLLDLVRRAAAVLGERYDVEIVERHHNKKLDAPSGTALMLAEAAADGFPIRRSTSMSARASAGPVRPTRSGSPPYGAAVLWGITRSFLPGGTRSSNCVTPR